MIKGECLLDIMEQKEYIEIREEKRNHYSRIGRVYIPCQYRVTSKINDSRWLEKIKEIIKKDPNFIFHPYKGGKTHFYYSKVEDIEDFIEDLRNTKQMKIRIANKLVLSENERVWIRLHSEFQSEAQKNEVFINTILEQEKLKEEDKKEQEAWKLLHSLVEE